MGNNTPDYEDNLVFPPETRSYEARLEEKLEIAVRFLEKIVTDESCVSCMDCLGSAYAEKALAKIKEIK